MATRGRKQSVSAQDILLTMVNDAINDVSDGNYLGRVASGREETAPAQVPSTYGYLQAARAAAPAAPAAPVEPAAPIAIANPNAAEAVPNAPTPVLDEPISPENASTPWRNELANAIAPYAIRDVVNAYNAKTQPIRYLMDTAGMVGNYISNTIAPAVSGFIGNTFSPSKMIGTLGDMILNGGEPMGTQPVQEIRQPVQEVYRYPVQEIYRYPVQENR